MPVQVWDDEYDSQDSEFSETEVYGRGPSYRGHVRQRSASRHRHEPRPTFLEPVQRQVHHRVHRSASTGGARRREREQLPTNINIYNEQAQRSDNHPENKQQSHRVQQRFKDNHSSHHLDVDEIPRAPSAPPRRERAASAVSREPSPLHRDVELAMGQHMLERNDFRQDMDLKMQQHEIDRLERELAKVRERNDRAPPPPPPGRFVDPRESRMLREEMEYEEDLANRLRNLQHMENKHNAEEEERKAAERYQMKRLEHMHLTEEEERKAEERYQLKKYSADKRAAAEEAEVKRKLREERLQEIARSQDEANEREKLMREEKWKQMAREKEEEEEREKLIQEIRDEDMRKARQAEEKRAKELAMKAAAVEEWKQEQERMKQRRADEAAAKAAAEAAAIAEWKLEQERIKQREAEAAEKKAKEFHDQLRSMGYSEEEIEAIVKGKEKKEKGEEKKEKHKEKEEETKVTWIKVHRKHLLPETLLAYDLPWDWDEHDHNFIVIKKWITEDFQEQLFAHTRRIRENKVIAQTSQSMTELKVNDHRKDKMFMVRKKNPKSRFFFA